MREKLDLSDGAAIDKSEPSTSSASDSGSSDGAERQAWGGQIEFILTCVGYAVGLGNVWRFPYLCYKNGGGAFLIPYVCMLALVGLPLFFMELSIGQFASLGPLAVWKFNPLFKGLGYASVMVSYLISIYYNVIIAICVFFLFKSMAAEVPFANCKNEWNTYRCITAEGLINKRNETYQNITANWTTTTPVYSSTTPPNTTFCPDLIRENHNLTYVANLTCVNYTTPSEEFFYHHVLQLTEGMNVPGGMRWELVGCLAFCWAICCVVLIKGISSLGKVVYFTALFPYVLLTILLVRGAMLEGALDGVIYYLEPKWEKLLEAEVWSDAAVQIFYSLGVASGGLMAMASYNKFNNNCLRDSLIVPIINCGTSIYAGFVIFAVLGNMAHLKETTVDKVADQGPGLTFVVYPEALTNMPLPPLWSILFFIMMMTLGFSSQFSMVECVLTAFLDEFPNILKKTRKHEIAFRVFACVLGFLLGVPMCMQGGFYLLNVVDKFVGGFPLIIVGMFELIAINWVYGYRNFSGDIEIMLGRKPPLYFTATWVVISPLLMLATLIFTAIQHKPLDFRGYIYPANFTAIGWLTVAFCVSLIVVVGLAYYCMMGGSKALKKASSPTDEWRPANSSDRVGTKYEKLKSAGDGLTNEAFDDSELRAPEYGISTAM